MPRTHRKGRVGGTVRLTLAMVIDVLYIQLLCHQFVCVVCMHAMLTSLQQLCCASLAHVYSDDTV